jgi:hypothetical protein
MSRSSSARWPGDLGRDVSNALRSVYAPPFDDFAPDLLARLDMSSRQASEHCRA